MTAHATGYVRVIERKDGPVAYAKLKLPDGSQPQRRLGKLWPKRSGAPAGYVTRSQAESRLQAILQGDDPLVNLEPSHVTFEQACAEHLRYLEHDKQLKPSTLKDYGNVVRHDLLPWFGETTPVEQITTRDIEALRAALLERVSRRTAQKILVVMHGVMGRAKRRGWIRENPCENAEKVALRRSGDFRVLGAGDVALLAQNAENAQDAVLFTVASFTGLRLGELLALRWGDVDFPKRRVHVRRSHVLGVDGTPKSHKVRSVPLIDQAARALDELSRREMFTDPDDRVFVSDVGGVVSQDMLRRRFKRAVKAAGLADLRLHDLRHTFGTLAVQAFALSDVKAYMGHAQIETTMLYVHHVPQHDAADRLGALVAQAETVHPTVHRTADMHRN